MNNQNQYSNEHINAYIDGELDTDERTRLLFDEQQDAALAKRINDARMLKEKVQLAYSDLSMSDAANKSFSCTAFVSKYKSLVAGFVLLLATSALLLPGITGNNEITLARQLIKSTPPISANDIEKTIGTHTKIVVSISQYQPENFHTTINNIEKILQQHRGDKSFSIELVAHKTGLKLLDSKTSAHAERITLLAKQFDNLDIVACAKSMADLANSGNPIKLIKDILVTPSAAEQVAKRMSNDWIFLKL